MGYRRLADTDAFRRVHYEAKVNVIEDQLVAMAPPGRYVAHRSHGPEEFYWMPTGRAFDWPPKREMAPWLRMRAEMAIARREIL